MWARNSVLLAYFPAEYLRSGVQHSAWSAQCRAFPLGFGNLRRR